LKTTSTEALSEPETSITLAELADNYWEEVSTEWKARTMTSYEGYKKYMLDKLGKNTQVHQIDYEQGRAYREALKAKKSLRGGKISSKTVNQYLEFAKAVFNYGKRMHYVKENPIEGLMVSQSKKKKKEKREAYTKTDLIKLFVESPEYGNDKWLKAHKFWIPIIGLFTGMRLEEICQLYVDNIRQEQGVWVFDINEEREDQSVKTAEQRLVPLHPFLTEDLHFLNYVQSLPQVTCPPKTDPDFKLEMC